MLLLHANPHLHKECNFTLTNVSANLVSIEVQVPVRTHHVQVQFWSNLGSPSGDEWMGYDMPYIVDQTGICLRHYNTLHYCSQVHKVYSGASHTHYYAFKAHE